MDTTIQQLMNYFESQPIDAYNWACDLFTQGYDAPILDKFVRLGTINSVTDEKITEILTLIGRPDLIDYPTLRREFEGQLIQSYFDGKIGGWALIQRCCDLYSGQRNIDFESQRFWGAVSDDADQHGGQCCIEFRFDRGEFDEVLRDAILRNNRPRARDATEPRDGPESPTGRLDNT
jgi:hypothetical protein